MNILHIMLACFYIDNFSYQENLLPKYQLLANNNIKILASNFTFNNEGKQNFLGCKREYINEFGIPVIRLDYKKNFFSKRLRQFVDLEKELFNANPDIIFVHGVQFLDLKKIIKYVKKNPGIKLYIDNHADFNNSAKNFLSRKILHGIIWKRLAHKALPYTEKFYGVTPARVDFLVDIYKLPKEKVELLPLGADDELVEKAKSPEIVADKRKEYGINSDEFVIFTGGKIDHNKPQTVELMKAVNQIQDINVKLLVFGAVSEELKGQFGEQLSDKVKYIGWKKSDEIYNEFSVADLIVFPGLHSVLWEQAVGMGKPCIFKDINGFNHVDLDGNCLFFEKDDIQEYKNKIKLAFNNIDKMKIIAEREGIKNFSYSKIAKKSIGLN